MNKTMKIITAAVVLGGVIGGITFNTTSHASATTEQEVQETANNYFNALKAGNPSEAVKYVHDYRFKDQTETLTAYKEMAKYDQIRDFKIISTKVKNEKNAEIIVQFTAETVGTQQLDLPVEKEGDSWKVIVKNVKKIKAKNQ